jgi:hypothetical protein
MFIRWLALDSWHPSDVSSNSSNSTELQSSAQRFSLFPLLRETSITGGEMTTLLLLLNVGFLSKGYSLLTQMLCPLFFCLFFIILFQQSVGLLGLLRKVNGKC